MSNTVIASSNVSDQLVSKLDEGLKYMYGGSNAHISAALTLFLIMYAVMIAPQLPEPYANLFDKWWFRLVFLFLIIFTAKKNPTLAVVGAIGFMISLETLNRLKFNKFMSRMMNSDSKTTERMENLMEGADMEEAVGPVMMEDGGIMEEGEMGPNVVVDMAEETKMIPAATMASAMEEMPAPVMTEVPTMAHPGSVGCTVGGNYRSNFYPQYVNMKPDAYTARFSGNDVVGWDPLAKYSSI